MLGATEGTSGNKNAKLAAGAYVAAVVVSAIPLITSKANLAGVGAILLTMPWSGLGVAISDSIDPVLLDSAWSGALTIAIGGLLNASIVYWVTARITRGGPDQPLLQPPPPEH